MPRNEGRSFLGYLTGRLSDSGDCVDNTARQEEADAEGQHNASYQHSEQHLDRLVEHGLRLLQCIRGLLLIHDHELCRSGVDSRRRCRGLIHDQVSRTCLALGCVGDSFRCRLIEKATVRFERRGQGCAHLLLVGLDGQRQVCL